jgi:hypothetical protein
MLISIWGLARRKRSREIPYLQSDEGSFGYLGINLSAVADGILYGIDPL